MRYSYSFSIISSSHYITLLVVSCFAPAARADSFDHYINPLLAKAIEGRGVKEMKALPLELVSDHDRVLPGVGGAMLIVRTNEGRYAKLLVQSARQKVDAARSIPILLIERFVTYREGQEQTVHTSGKSRSLFPGFRLSLDIGQIVPEELSGDVRLIVKGDDVQLEPLGKAKLYLLTKPLPEATPKKTEKLVIGETFQPRYFNGAYQLYDDGRRSGTLKLEVGDDGAVTGAYYSAKDGQKYDVFGKIGSPSHRVQFTVKFPRTEQIFQGWLFTGDGKYLTGSSRMLDREAGFVAIRIEEK